MRIAPAAAACLAALILSSCSSNDGDLDDPAQTACDDLAVYMQTEEAEGREQTLLDIAATAEESKHTDIVHGARSLEDLADVPGWESGADVLASACLDHGYE